MADRLVGQEAGGQAEGNCTLGDHTGSCSPCTLDWLISVLSISPLQQVGTEPVRLKLTLITPPVKKQEAAHTPTRVAGLRERLNPLSMCSAPTG